MNFVKIAACCALLAATPAVAQPVVLKFGSGSPSASDIWKGYLEPWAKRVEAASKGALKIELHPDGSLGANGQTFDRVDAKVAEIGWDIPLVYGQRFASLTVVGLPFMYEDTEKAAGAVWRLHARGMFPELAPYKVIAFTINPNVNLFLSKPIADTANLAGTKVAVGSKVRGQMVQAMKGVPVSVVVPEYYQSLSRGVVGGVMTNVQVLAGLEARRGGALLHRRTVRRRRERPLHGQEEVRRAPAGRAPGHRSELRRGRIEDRGPSRRRSRKRRS